MHDKIFDKLMELNKAEPTNYIVSDEFALRESAQTYPSPVKVNPNTKKLEYEVPDFDESIFEEAAKILESLEEEYEMGILEDLEKFDIVQEDVVADENAIDDPELNKLLEQLDAVLEELSEEEGEEIEAQPEDSLEANEEEPNDENAVENEEENEVEVVKLDDGTIVVTIDGQKYVCKPENAEQTEENEEEGEDLEEAFKLDEDIDLERFVQEAFSVFEESKEEDTVDIDAILESLEL